MLLGSILLASLMGGVLSVLVAAMLMKGLPQRWLPRMVGFSAGLLLGLATLSVLPEAFEAQVEAQDLFAFMLAGFLGLYALQRITLWRHVHDEPVHAGHRNSHGLGLGSDTVLAVLVGDGFHNFVDGVLIAAAFLTDPMLGWAAALAVTAHEIPQEAGDFVLLLTSGLSRRRALALNALSGLASVAGAVVGYVALAHAQSMLPYILILAASSFIYIAIADLLPLLRRELAKSQVLWQTGAMAAGLAMAAALSTRHGH